MKKQKKKFCVQEFMNNEELCKFVNKNKIEIISINNGVSIFGFFNSSNGITLYYYEL